MGGSVGRSGLISMYPLGLAALRALRMSNSTPCSSFRLRKRQQVSTYTETSDRPAQPPSARQHPRCRPHTLPRTVQTGDRADPASRWSAHPSKPPVVSALRRQFPPTRATTPPCAGEDLGRRPARAYLHPRPPLTATGLGLDFPPPTIVTAPLPSARVTSWSTELSERSSGRGHRGRRT